MNTDNPKRILSIKQGLLLLGSFSIACDMSIIFHELSHGLAAVLTGGTFVNILINPFSWSYCISFTDHQLLHSLAGAAGEILFGVLLFCILYRWARPWLLPILLIGPIALIDSGSYYFVDIVMRSAGDACRLIDQGIPAAASASAGVLCIVVGFILAVLLIRKIGLLRFTFRGRLIVLSIGILPNAMGMLIWNGIYNRGEFGLWAVYSGATVLLILVFATIPERFFHKNAKTSLPLSWKPVIFTNVLYTCLLVFFLTGPFSASALSGPETFKERPVDFSPVMVPPSFADNVSFWSSTSPQVLVHCLSYDFPESIAPEQIRSYLTELYQSHGYHITNHLIEDPNELPDDNWIEETEKIYGIQITSKSYKQSWIKIGSHPLRSMVMVDYMWKKCKFDNAYVIQTTSPTHEYESLYNYVSVHPDQFDPNEIEQLKLLLEVDNQAENKSQ